MLCDVFDLFSRVLRGSAPHFICPSDGSLVDPPRFTFSMFLRSLASLLLPKRYGDLKYGASPPARNWVAVNQALVCMFM